MKVFPCFLNKAFFKLSYFLSQIATLFKKLQLRAQLVCPYSNALCFYRFLHTIIYAVLHFFMT